LPPSNKQKNAPEDRRFAQSNIPQRALKLACMKKEMIPELVMNLMRKSKIAIPCVFFLFLTSCEKEELSLDLQIASIYDDYFKETDSYAKLNLMSNLCVLIKNNQTKFFEQENYEYALGLSTARLALLRADIAKMKNNHADNSDIINLKNKAVRMINNSLQKKLHNKVLGWDDIKSLLSEYN
jgi:hypothetical protein